MAILIRIVPESVRGMGIALMTIIVRYSLPMVRTGYAFREMSIVHYLAITALIAKMDLSVDSHI
jgi:hypothetical protein